MRSERSLGRKAPERLGSGALALAFSLAGCGAAVSVRNDSEIAKTKRLLARLRFPRTTLTPKELGETYAETVWPVANKGFKPFYNKITERDVFDWKLLDEIHKKRGDFFAKQEKIRAAERRVAQKAAARERKKKMKADARAAAEAKRAEEKEAKAKKAEAARKAEPAPAAAATPSK